MKPHGCVALTAVAALISACPQTGKNTKTEPPVPGSALPSGSPAARNATGTASPTDIEPRLPRDQVIATFKGGKVTYGDLFDGYRGEFRALQNKYSRELLDLERARVTQKVTDALIEREAKAKGVGPADYIQTLRGNPAVSEEEIKTIYEKSVPAGGPTLDVLRSQIRQHILQQKQQEILTTALADLRKRAGAKFDVPVPSVALATFKLEGRPMKGKESAKITVVEFSDFQCPYCARAAPAATKLVEAFPNDVKLYFLHFPLSFHKQAIPAAMASQCGNEQGKFWEIHDKIFAQPEVLTEDRFLAYAKEAGLDTAKFEACMANPATRAFVAEDLKQGEAAGVDGTPSFFINGLKFQRGVPTPQTIQEYMSGS